MLHRVFALSGGSFCPVVDGWIDINIDVPVLFSIIGHNNIMAYYRSRTQPLSGSQPKRTDVPILFRCSKLPTRHGAEKEMAGPAVNFLGIFRFRTVNLLVLKHVVVAGIHLKITTPR